MREYRSAAVSRSGTKSIVSDMDFTIYCHWRRRRDPSLNLKLIDAIRLSPGEHEFFFEDPDDVIRKLEIDYANSEASDLLNCQRDIKRFLRDTARITQEKAREVDRHERHRQGRG